MIDRYPLNECAVTYVLGEKSTTVLTTQIAHLVNLILERPFPGFISCVPAYTSLTIYYNPAIVARESALKDSPIYKHVYKFIDQIIVSDQLAQNPSFGTKEANNQPNIIEIPVQYGGAHGPDLEILSKELKLSEDEIVYLHSASLYTVGMIGFMPGFTYLHGLETALHAPRKASPRMLVPAGSIGIAGSQTGIYSMDSPGGWNIIGKTSIKIFDPNKVPPTPFKLGDLVKFIKLDEVI